MDCLNCGTEMTNTTVQTRQAGLSYDMCDACGSLWLDAGELDKLAVRVQGSIEYSSIEPTPGNPKRRKKCPRCQGASLDSVHFLKYTDLFLDRCSNCGGFWLDGGELDLVNKTLQDIMPVKGDGLSAFITGTHLPRWYKRVRKKSSETDFEVPVLPLKGAVLKATTSDVCPACRAALDLYSAFGADIESCQRCRGMWLAHDQLRRLKDRAEQGSWRTLRWLDDEVEAIDQAHGFPSTRECPKCSGQKLMSTKFGDSVILIDWCAGCRGVWLDENEYRAIVDHLKQELDSLSSAEMRAKLAEELREIWQGPEGRLSEVLDVKAAIDALINITIFEHPTLVRLLSLPRLGP